MVMKRASIEPNFHDLYLKFIDKINSKALHKEIIKTTYENGKVLLSHSSLNLVRRTISTEKYGVLAWETHHW